MSITVELDDLASCIEHRRWCYLLTVSDSARPHVVALRPAMIGEGPRFELEAGSGTAWRNVLRQPHVTMVFPPVDATDLHYHDHSLVVDGTADPIDGRLRITPTSAVWHRPAP